MGVFEQIATKAYGNPRIPPGTRELILAIGYGAYLDPKGGRSSALDRARVHLGRDRGGSLRINRLVQEDRPRYEMPERFRPVGPGMAPGCAGPRLRPYKPRAGRTLPGVHGSAGYPPPREDHRNRDKVCGAPSRHRVPERDPLTGRIATVHWFCDRHRAEVERVEAQLASINESAPEPIPNTGGWLPVFFSGDWGSVYRHYAPMWNPPGYGIRADEWPDPETMTEGGGVKRPRLRVVK